MPSIRFQPRLSHILFLFAALILLRGIAALPGVIDWFMSRDNDDLTRMVVLREWLAGQGWFDDRLRRLLPPEGVSIHWSRYVDAGLAAVLLPLSLLVDMPRAEALMLVIWPSLLLFALITVVTKTAGSLMGRVAALAAATIAFLWSKLGGVEFGIARIDHHNVQILACTGLLALLIAPTRRPAVAGALAGALAAFSLAVGLEMLPFLLLVWGLAMLRLLPDPASTRGRADMDTGVSRWLTGFGAGLGIAAPLLLAGQRPPSDWASLHCDALALPALSLVWAGVAATFGAVLLLPRLGRPLWRLLALLALAALALAITAPLIGPCLSGPYGAMTEEAQAIIRDRVSEAQPALSLIRSNTEAFVGLVLPVLLLVIAGGVLAATGWRRLTAAQRLAVTVLLAISGTGAALSLYQVRALNVATPAVPLLGGFIAWQLVDAGRRGHQRLAALSALVLGTAVLAPHLILRGVNLITPEPSGTATAQSTYLPPSQACRTGESADALAALPPSVVMTNTNLGPFVMAFSRHAATAAPYHRSSAAFTNGLLPFETRRAMIAALRETGADVIALCWDAEIDAASDWSAQLLAGELPDWLTQIGDGAGSLVLFRVDHAALAAEP